ncbi:zeta toxin family protein [Paraneptunicella aestuarii]|uniref:zeta toxin family protein n=1 Tax=Paraneptunicella aestuarii TaxID=2831148 RepID=UPI001E40D963|nr:zeta toxin family protein [Paraneptunicella aestuarii]UAA38592.1 zeta toxin family protein [Paraneptunicella aestuarii]
MLADIAYRITGYHYKDIHKAFESISSGMDSPDIIEACELLETMINQKLSQIKPAITTKNNPELLVVAGIPYSGKSTHIRAHISPLLKQNTSCIVSFDDIMQTMPLYQRLMLNNGAETAFLNTELVARIAGYELLSRAIQQGHSIIFEHSSALQEHVNLYRIIKQEFAYSTQMQVLKISLEQAYQRASSNQQRDSGRHTPKAYIEDRHQALNSLLPEYESIMPVHYIESHQ